MNPPWLLQVAAAIRGVDSAFAKLALPAFYDPPRPHVSIAWAVGDREDAFGRIPALWEQHQRRRGGEAGQRGPAERPLGVAVDTVEAVIGKRAFAVWGSERMEPGQRAAFLAAPRAGGGGTGDASGTVSRRPASDTTAAGRRVAAASGKQR